MHLASAPLMHEHCLTRRGFLSVSVSWFHPEQQALKVWRVEANPAATFVLLSPWSGLILEIFLNRKKNDLSNCFPSEEKPHINHFYVSGCLETFILCTNHFLQLLHPLKSLSYSYLGFFGYSVCFVHGALCGNRGFFNSSQHTPMRQCYITGFH